MKYSRGFLSFQQLAFSNLNNSVANSSLSCLNGNNSLSNGNWNYSAQISVATEIVGKVEAHCMAAPGNRCSLIT